MAFGWGLVGRKGGCGCVGSHLKSTKKSACDVSTRESPGTTPNEYTQSWGKVCHYLYSGYWFAQPHSAENIIQGQEPSARFILLVELHTDSNCSFYSERQEVA